MTRRWAETHRAPSTAPAHSWPFMRVLSWLGRRIGQDALVRAGDRPHRIEARSFRVPSPLRRGWGKGGSCPLFF